MKYNITLEARIWPSPPATGGGLEVREDATVEANGFMEVCAVLAKFHELMETLKANSKGSVPRQ